MIIPATTEMWACITDPEPWPEDAPWYPRLIVAWEVPDDGDRMPVPICVDEGLLHDPSGHGYAIHTARDPKNLLDMVKRIAEKNAKNAEKESK